MMLHLKRIFHNRLEAKGEYQSNIISSVQPLSDPLLPVMGFEVLNMYSIAAIYLVSHFCNEMSQQTQGYFVTGRQRTISINVMNMH